MGTPLFLATTAFVSAEEIEGTKGPDILVGTLDDDGR
jgi:hypothetical protein